MAINSVSGLLDSVGHKTDAAKSFILEYVYFVKYRLFSGKAVATNSVWQLRRVNSNDPLQGLRSYNPLATLEPGRDTVLHKPLFLDLYYEKPQE